MNPLNLFVVLLGGGLLALVIGTLMAGLAHLPKRLWVRRCLGGLGVVLMLAGFVSVGFAIIPNWEIAFPKTRQPAEYSWKSRIPLITFMGGLMVLFAGMAQHSWKKERKLAWLMILLAICCFVGMISWISGRFWP